jgi:hypothetical protein
LGNGEKVSVWNYPWLRNENQAYITTPMIEGREDMKVSELIDHDIGKWNITLIQHFFNPWDVEIFLWRVLRGCLPVRGRLAQKGVPCNNKCPYCEMNEENEWRVFRLYCCGRGVAGS